MEVLVPGTTARHWEAQADDESSAEEPRPGTGSRLLQWIGLVAVAAAAGVVLAFGAGPATEAQAAVTQAAQTQAAQTTQVAQPTPPPNSSGGKRDAWLGKIRDLAKKAKDPAVRKLAKEYLDFADRFPTTSCLSQCFLEELAQDDSPGAKSLTKHLMKCSAKCLDKEDFKRRLAEWQLDRGQREKLRKAEEAARNTVRDLTRKVNEGRASQDQLDKARKDLAQAVEARKNYERARTLQDRADRLRQQAAKAKSSKERDRLLRQAERKEQQAGNVREGRDKNDNGPGRAGPKDGDGGGRTSARVPRWLKKLFGAMGYFAIGSEILDKYLQEKALLDARYLAALRQLHDYVERHPYEADELAPLFQRNELPLLDPERMAEFLRDWDADHDDVTGEEITSDCEIFARLGGGYCGPDPVSRERRDLPRDRDPLTDDRRPFREYTDPDESRTERFQPDTYRSDPFPRDDSGPDSLRPDGQSPYVYQPGVGEVTSGDVVIVEPDSGSSDQDSDSTSRQKSSKPAKKKSTSSTSKKSTTKKSTTSTTSKSTTKKSTSTTSTSKRSTSKSTSTTSKSTTKKSTSSTKTSSERDKALEQLAKEKSSEFARDKARDALSEDKKQMSTREKA